MKKIIALTLALLMSFSCFSIISFAEETQTPEHLTEVPDGYIGVYSIEDLYCIRNDLTANYILMNDIDLTDATAEGGDWNYGGRGWNPIGSNDTYSNNAFSGVFDGNGYSVKGISINIKSSVPSGTSALYLGLFSKVDGTVKNLTVSGSISSEKSSSTYIGGISGACGSSAVFENCTNLVNIYCYNISPIYAGGVVGFNNGSITKCRNLGKIEISGKHSSEYVSNRTYKGNSYAGGIAGKTAQETSVISKCINAGEIIAVSRGGSSHWSTTGTINTHIVYYYYYADVHASGITSGETGNVINCYNVGNISASLVEGGEYAGLYAAGVSYGCPVSYCYNIGSSTGYSVGNKALTKCYCIEGSGSLATDVSSLTPGQMKLQSMYSGFDFNSVWTMEGRKNYFYPELCDVELLRAEDLNHKHSYTSEISTQATHLTEGVETFTCSCGESYTQVIPKLNNHTYESDVTAPTCTAKGYTTYTCECGDSYVADYVDALDHSFTKQLAEEKYFKSAATYSAPAEYYYACERCSLKGDESYTFGEALNLGQPETVSAIQTTDTINLSWTAVPDAAGYRVFVRENNKWVQIKKATTATEYTVTGLTAGTKYTYAVRAYVIENGVAVWAPSFTTFTTATQPALISKVTSTKQTETSITLSWDKVTCTGYRVFQYNPTTKKWNIVIRSTKSTTGIINGLTENTNYIFAVRPYVNTGIEIIWAKTYTKVTTSTMLPAITLKALSSAKNRATIAWGKAAGATGYQVWYSTSPSSGYKKVANYTNNSTYQYNLTSGTTYYYRARAYKAVGGSYVYGAWSDVVSVTIK